MKGKNKNNIKKSGKQVLPIGMKNIKAFVIIVVVALAVIAVYGMTSRFGKKDDSVSIIGEDLIIQKDEVTEIARFYPYTADKTYMEVIAVKSNDNSVRIALNTCQVCYNSGQGYYRQSGQELICQNCGNRFKIDDIGKYRGGCNPVPIDGDQTIEDDGKIIIAGQFLGENKLLFQNWKRR